MTRTFLTLGPAGMALEWSNEDAPEPDYLASSPAPQAADESTGAWIIHHPSKGGTTSGLREVLTEAAIFGVSSARSLSTPATVAKLHPSTSRARDLPRTVGNRKARRAEVARRRTGR